MAHGVYFYFWTAEISIDYAYILDLCWFSKMVKRPLIISLNRSLHFFILFLYVVQFDWLWLTWLQWHVQRVDFISTLYDVTLSKRYLFLSALYSCYKYIQWKTLKTEIVSFVSMFAFVDLCELKTKLDVGSDITKIKLIL